MDTLGNVSENRAYTNGFVEQDQGGAANTSRGGYTLATKVITANSNESTFSNTEGTEEMYGAMLVWSGTAPFSITATPSDTKVG